MKISITQPGTLTTVQDGGRFGLAHLGVPVSGFMDRKSAHKANRLLGNRLDEGLLEVTWGGVGFITDVACSIAVTGARFECVVNDLPVDADQVIHLQAGDEFKMGHLLVGVRAYVAVAGGFNVPMVGGSVSTLTVAHLGGFDGRPLLMGDQLSLTTGGHVDTRRLPEWQLLKSQTIHVIRAMPGPEINHFAPTTVQQAFGQAYQITKDSSRQGFRLQSDSIEYPKGLHNVSTGLVPGSLQVTPDGQTILAMQDAQTTGGYPRMLVVNQDELHKLAQIRPGEDIYFFRSG